MVIKVKYNGEWVKIPYLSTGGDSGTGYVEEAPKNGQQYTRKDGAWTVLNIPDDITETINNKVDKVEGKELSSNDFTDAYKAKLDSLNNYTLTQATGDVLGGIKIGYAENGKNYPVELSDGKAFVNVPWTDTNTTYSNATTSTAGLMSAADKAKLDAYPAYSSITTAVYYLSDALAALTNDSTSQQVSDAIGGVEGLENIITKIKDGIRIRLPKLTFTPSNAAFNQTACTYYWEACPSWVTADGESVRGFSFAYFGYDPGVDKFIRCYIIILYMPDSGTFRFQRYDYAETDTQALLDTNNVINN